MTRENSIPLRASNSFVVVGRLPAIISHLIQLNYIWIEYNSLLRARILVEDRGVVSPCKFCGLPKLDPLMNSSISNVTARRL